MNKVPKKFILCNDPVCEGALAVTELERVMKLKRLSPACPVIPPSGMTFGQAMEHLAQEGGNYKVSREAWKNTESTPIIKLQRPDQNSKMTEAYLYMQKFVKGKGTIRFPINLSVESTLATDWYMVI